MRWTAHYDDEEIESECDCPNVNQQHEGSGFGLRLRAPALARPGRSRPRVPSLRIHAVEIAEWAHTDY